MNGLLDIATVVEGDGHWTSGHEIDALACGRTITSVDVCAPGTVNRPDDAGTGYKVVPFAVLGDQKFGARCEPSTAMSDLLAAMDTAAEYTVARNFWLGDAVGWSSELNMSDAGVATVAAGATVQETLASVLSTAFTAHPELQPIVHLGYLSALQLADTLAALELDLNICVSPGYPVDAVGVTGQVLVRLGSVELLHSPDTSVNRTYLAATRLAAVEFDPCLAVRAG